MEKNKVSVIMSCYNAEKTLARAMSSVLDNSYKNIELVLIEDCSTDNSLAIASDFKNRDNRVRIIQHKKNLGAGISRKDGIEGSVGEYICFCDSDDVLLPDHISNLVEASLKYDADIVTSGYTIVDGETGKHEEERKADKIYILEDKSKYAILKADILRFLNPSLVKRCLWDKVTYSTRRYIEDSPTLIKLLWYANKRVILPQSTYLYYQNTGSLIHTSNSFKDILYQTLCIIETYNFFSQVNHPEFAPDEFMLGKVMSFLSVKPSKSNKLEYKDEIQEVKRFINYYYEKKFEQSL